MVASGQKGSLKHIAGWWMLKQLLLGITIQKHFLFIARVKYADIVILGNPSGQVCLTQSRRHGRTWHASSVLRYHWGQQKLGNNSFLQLVL